MQIKFKLSLLFLILTSSLFSQPQNANITFKVTGIKDTTCLLAYRFGQKIFVKDTITVNEKGIGIYKEDGPLAGGVYLYVLPDKNFIEFVISDQQFTLETKSSDLIGSMKVTGSPENQIFFDYRKYIDPKGVEINELMEKAKVLEADSTADHSEEIAELREKATSINKTINDYREKVMTDHPNAFLTRLFLAMKEPNVPETPILPNGRPDSTFAYRYFKAHYFDHINFQDSSLLRTPIFDEKVKYYMESLVLQIPDSVNKELDSLLHKSMGNDLMMEYMLKTFTSKYERSKLMTAENIFVHLVENYYNEKYTPWMDSAQRARVIKRSDQLSPILVGKKAPNLLMLDYYNNPQALHNIKSDYTILYFWAFDCGHCKKVTPKLFELYEQYKDSGLSVFAVSTKQEMEGWKQYIEEKNLTWINVHDIGGRNRIHDIYDIYSTPVIYLLDKDKKILAKRLDIEQIEQFLQREIKEKS